jgi:hypothetical protein
MHDENRGAEDKQRAGLVRGGEGNRDCEQQSRNPQGDLQRKHREQQVGR